MKQLSLAIICLVIFSNLALGQASNSIDNDTPQDTFAGPIHQLRIYEIPKHNRGHFNDRFRDHALRIMRKYDFNVVAIWESDSENKLEFIYLLEWQDEGTMKMAWDKFMSDQEWKDIKAATSKLHGTFVNSIEDRTLFMTNYSPQN